MNAIGLAPIVLRLSASQVQTFVDCQRKWSWKYVEGVEVPSNASADLGRAVHAELEKYLTGGEIDFTSETGYIAASGLEHLPKPGTWVHVTPKSLEWVPTPGLYVEQEFHFVGPSGHSYLGFKDVEAPGIIYDHKTTSNLRWQKTPEDLKTDIQATLYAVDYFRKNPDENDVELRWVYYQTKNTRKSAVTRLRVGQTETWKRFLEIEQIAVEMSAAATKRALELPPSINHCSAYGGCPHQGRCNLSPFDKMRSYTEQQKIRTNLRPPMENKLLAALQSKKNGAAAHVPVVAVAPAPAAGAPAPAPVQNKLLARMRAAGAPAASAPAPVASAPAPAAINPPEYQPPPAAPRETVVPSRGPDAELAATIARQRAAMAVVAPPAGAADNGAALAAFIPVVSDNGAALAASLSAAAEPATRGRGRPKKAELPATGIALKIDTLYIDCGPVGRPVVDAAQIVALAKKRILDATGLADYRFAEFGQGPGMLAVAVVAELEALDGLLPAVRLDTRTPEGGAIAAELVARAGLVVR